MQVSQLVRNSEIGSEMGLCFSETQGTILTLRAGTTRLQLEHKGDYDHTYTDLANILPCAGILGLPLISWLLDKKVVALEGCGV